MTVTFHTNQRLGTYVDADGATVAVVVRCELRIRPGEVETVDHTRTTDPVELGLSGETFEVYPNALTRKPGYSAERGAGQIVDDLDRITTPAPGWTLEEVREVAQLWRRWHLNTMRAACAHMDPDALVREPNGYGGERIACGTVNACPVTGYTYGAAWLTQPLPESVELRIRQILRQNREVTA